MRQVGDQRRAVSGLAQDLAEGDVLMKQVVPAGELHGVVLAVVVEGHDAPPGD